VIACPECGRENPDGFAFCGFCGAPLAVQSSGSVREELRKFKQRLETGEIPISDGPGLSRPAQPRRADEVNKLAEVAR